MRMPTIPSSEESKVVSRWKRMKNVHGKKKLVLLIAGVLLIVLIAVVGGFIANSQKSNTQSHQEKTVSRQDIQSKLTGTGTLQPLNQYNVSSLVKGEVLSCSFEEGDIVQKGELLYTIDSSDVQNNIEKSKLSVEQSNASYQQQMESLGDLSVRANKSGVITEINVEEGDQVQAGSKIATVRDSATMLLKVTFNSADAERFYIGETASITVDGSFETLSGSVTQIDGADTVLIGNQIVRNVTISVSNPGALSSVAAGSAVINGVASNSGANFTYKSESSITAEVSGKVASLAVHEGSTVTNGQLVCTLKSSSLENQVKSSALSVKNANLSLQSTIDSMDDYSVYAPISGTVVTKNTKVGDSIDSSSGTTTLAVIYDMSALKFEIALDELDVNQVQVGQEVEVSVEALDGKTFTGKITNISVAGTTSNGATTYPVTVQIDHPPADLLPGMNVNASIITGEASNAIVIPLEAVQRGNLVYVKGDGSKSTSQTGTQATEQGKGSNDAGKMPTKEAPEGFHAVKVKTGLSDDTNIEITSGLSEGDIIYVPQITHESSTSSNQMMPGGGMGGMPEGGGGGKSGGPNGASAGGGMP